MRSEWKLSVLDEERQMIVSVQAINLKELDSDKLFEELVNHTLECDTCLNLLTKLNATAESCEDVCSEYRHIQKLLLLCDASAKAEMLAAELG